MTTLGFDTSNYTTSCAIYNSDTGQVNQHRKLLPVEKGERGLRQSEAVFAHLKQLPGLLDALFETGRPPDAIGVSVRPRDVEGSYMPCFLVGETVARGIAATGKIPIMKFSHQAGHLAAALYGAGALELITQPFLAFHASGGTTECLLVNPGKRHPFEVSILGKTLDLAAGQVIDRVGVLLGTGFPAGPELERMAAQTKPLPFKPALKGADCCLSGLENQCAGLLEEGKPPEQIAAFCQNAVGETLLAMAGQATKMHPGLPFVFAGGVMSNNFLRQRIEERVEGAKFAPASLSADNAVGIAILAAI